MPSGKELLDNNWKLTTREEIASFFAALQESDLDTICRISTANPKILKWVSNYGTMLHAAAALSSVEVADYLLSQGFAVDEQHPLTDPREGEVTPLMRAACRRNTSKMVRFLVERGANVNACARKHSTPLHHAAFVDNVETVRYLLEHGADWSYENEDGLTPLATALKSKSEGAAALLKEKGAPLKGIPVLKPPVRGAATIDVSSFAPAIRQLIGRAIERYTKEHPDEALTCAALNASGVHGFVSVCFEPGKFEGDVPGMTYAQYETLEVPEWRDPYDFAKKVRITPHIGRVIIFTPGESDEDKYQKPFFNFLVHLLKEMAAERRFDPLPRKEGFNIGLEMMDGSYADFWTVNYHTA